MNDTNFVWSVQGIRKLLVWLGVFSFFSVFLWMFFGFRINVPQDHILVLVKKFGKNPPPDSILALDPSEKGIQYQVKSEGWHWYNSFTWEREIHKATIIQPDSLGVLIRQYGNPLKEGEILASSLNLQQAVSSDTRGIVEEVLTPGKYNINPYAYRVEIHPATQIPAGHVGVVLNKAYKDEKKFTFLSSSGFKGVQKELKEAGRYYLNPYVYEVLPYNIRIQKTDFDENSSLSFMSYDSYEIKMTATVEWAVSKDKVAEVYVRVGTLKDVEDTIIVPFARSFCRLIGSESMAKDYISGDTRKNIQDKFYDSLRGACEEFGIEIKSVLIRKIIPPTVLREIINTRGLEKEKRNKIEKDIEKVKSDAMVAKRKEEILQGQSKVEEDIRRSQALIKIKGDREINLKNAQKRLGIARLNLDVAEVEKATIVEQGKADLIKEFNIREAEVEALRREIISAGGGEEYARQIFNQKIKVKRIFTNDTSPVASMINQFASEKAGVK